MNLLFDAPDQELWLDETNRGSTVVPAFANAYLWGVTNHRVGFSEPYLLSQGNPYGKDSFPPHAILRRMLLVLTYWEKRKNVFNLHLPEASALTESRVSTYLGAEPVTFKGNAIQVRPNTDTATIGATLRVKGKEGISVRVPRLEIHTMWQN